jgi:hypothetical protein
MLDEVLELLRLEFSTFSQTFIIVDASDECKDEDDPRQTFVSKILGLQSSSNVNLMVASRYSSDSTVLSTSHTLRYLG